MAHRIVIGLQWVRKAKNPWPRIRARGVRARGLAFEKQVAKLVPKATRNPWYEFADKFGPGYCSPDIVFVYAGHIVVLECKLTDCVEAYTQIAGLYKPVLEHYYERPVWGIVVAKNLTFESEDPHPTLASALASPKGIALWHCPFPTRTTLSPLFDSSPLPCA